MWKRPPGPAAEHKRDDAKQPLTILTTTSSLAHLAFHKVSDVMSFHLCINALAFMCRLDLTLGGKKSVQHPRQYQCKP
jgi:hypothetical protein